MGTMAHGHTDHRCAHLRPAGGGDFFPARLYVAGRAMVMATNGAAASARLRVSFGGGGTRLYEWMSVLRDVRAAQHMLHGAVKIPPGYTTVRLMLYMYGTGTELTGGG